IDIDLLVKGCAPNRHRLAEALEVPVREQVDEDAEEPARERSAQELASVVVTVLHEERVPQAVLAGDRPAGAELLDAVVDVELRRDLAGGRPAPLDLPVDGAVLGDQVLDLVKNETPPFVLPLEGRRGVACPIRLREGAVEHGPVVGDLLGVEVDHRLVLALDPPVGLVLHKREDRQGSVDLVVVTHDAEVCKGELAKVELDDPASGEAEVPDVPPGPTSQGVTRWRGRLLLVDDPALEGPPLRVNQLTRHALASSCCAKPVRNRHPKTSARQGWRLKASPAGRDW